VSGLLAFFGSGIVTSSMSQLGSLRPTPNDRVVIVPTAAAYESPNAVVESAIQGFAGDGIEAGVCLALSRTETDAPRFAHQVGGATFLYLTDGSAMHLRGTFKDSAVWQAIVSAWEGGATLAAAPGSAMAIGDPMIDPRGGAFTLGLGLIRDFAIIPAANTWSAERRKRTLKMAGTNVCLAMIDDNATLVRTNEGEWKACGKGHVTVLRNGEEYDVSSLAELLAQP
jgi:cyanophycinase